MKGASTAGEARRLCGAISSSPGERHPPPPPPFLSLLPSLKRRFAFPQSKGHALHGWPSFEAAARPKARSATLLPAVMGGATSDPPGLSGKLYMVLAKPVVPPLSFSRPVKRKQAGHPEGRPLHGKSAPFFFRPLSGRSPWPVAGCLIREIFLRGLQCSAGTWTARGSNMEQGRLFNASAPANLDVLGEAWKRRSKAARNFPRWRILHWSSSLRALPVDDPAGPSFAVTSRSSKPQTRKPQWSGGRRFSPVVSDVVKKKTKGDTRGIRYRGPVFSPRPIRRGSWRGSKTRSSRRKRGEKGQRPIHNNILFL